MEARRMIGQLEQAEAALKAQAPQPTRTASPTIGGGTDATVYRLVP